MFSFFRTVLDIWEIFFPGQSEAEKLARSDKKIVY